MLPKNNSAVENDYEKVNTLKQSDPDDEPESDPYGLEDDADSDDSPWWNEIEGKIQN